MTEISAKELVDIIVKKSFASPDIALDELEPVLELWRRVETGNKAEISELTKLIKHRVKHILQLRLIKRMPSMDIYQPSEAELEAKREAKREAELQELKALEKENELRKRFGLEALKKTVKGWRPEHCRD